MTLFVFLGSSDLGNPLALSGESVSPLNPIRKEYFRTPTFPIVNHVLSLNTHTHHSPSCSHKIEAAKQAEDRYFNASLVLRMLI